MRSRCWGWPIRQTAPIGGPTGASGPAKPRPGTVFDQPEPEELIELTVIVPARNEEDCLGACLQSLVSQSEEIFELGRDWELIVVDDHSTDRTAEIARGFAGVTVMEAGKLEPGWTGQGQRRVDGGAAGARPMAAVYRCRYGSRAGRSAPGNARGGAAQGGHAELLAAADCERAWRSGRSCRWSFASWRWPIRRPRFQIPRSASPRPTASFCWWSGRLTGGSAATPAWPARCWKMWSWRFWPSGARSDCASAMPTTPCPRACTAAPAAMIEGWTKNLALLFDNALMLAIWRALDFLLLFGLPVLAYQTVERATWRAWPGVAGRGMGAGAALAADAVPVLCAGGQVEFSVPRLRDGAAGPAAVCGAALSQLVSAPHPEARKLEGAELRGVGWPADRAAQVFEPTK